MASNVTDKITPSRHRLSADAKEFIPASVRSTHVNTEQVLSPVSNYAVAIFRGYIEDLMQEPGMYDATIAELKQNLPFYVHNEAIASKLAEDLIQHSIKESNFRYTGARLSDVLSTCLSTVNFKNQFLHRCGIQFSKKNELIATKEGQKHLIGFSLFVGELLLNMRLKDGGMIEIFRDAIFQLLSLFMSAPNDDTVRCVTHLLKLTGGVLETRDQQSPELDSLFDEIKSFIVSSNSSTGHRQMLLNLIKLRAKDWQR